MERAFIIKHHSQSVYWSNEFGWTILAEATRFTKAERDTLALPMEGVWIQTQEGYSIPIGRDDFGLDPY